MAQINFGGVNETVVTREEFPLEKARKVLENETIAVIGYGVQGPGQSLNLRDNGFNVIVGQREGTRSWERAVAAMKAHAGAYLLEVRVENEENVFPMVPAGAPVSDIRLE